MIQLIIVKYLNYSVKRSTWKSSYIKRENLLTKYCLIVKQYQYTGINAYQLKSLSRQCSVFILHCVLYNCFPLHTGTYHWLFYHQHNITNTSSVTNITNPTINNNQWSHATAETLSLFYSRLLCLEISYLLKIKSVCIAQNLSRSLVGFFYSYIQ